VHATGSDKHGGGGRCTGDDPGDVNKHEPIRREHVVKDAGDQEREKGHEAGEGRERTGVESSTSTTGIVGD